MEGGGGRWIVDRDTPIIKRKERRRRTPQDIIPDAGESRQYKRSYNFDFFPSVDRDVEKGESGACYKAQGGV